MSKPDQFAYDFFPVGQGLYAAGSLTTGPERASRFLWVYDCGTSSAQVLVDLGIAKLAQAARPRGRVDLLTLSHFDHDHISGVVRLIERFRIGTIMLPYMPLAQRLLVAFEERLGDPADPMTAFFVNPVAYLLGLDGPGIDRILFVLPSSDEGPPLAGGTDQSPDWGDDTPDIRFARDKPPDREEWALLVNTLDAGADESAVAEMAASSGTTEVVFLKNGSSIEVGALWEFVPYNDDPQDRILDVFRSSVIKERERLLGTGTRARNSALRALRRLYDAQFGRGPREHNIISLFLYSGPIYPGWKRARFGWARTGADWWKLSGTAFDDLPLGEFDAIVPEDRRHARCSVIYPGDGYLDTSQRLQRLVKFLSQERVAKAAVFQVMHHGAEGNWHRGVADAISPRFSVFSSDPRRKNLGHPHAAVLHDFWRYNAVQVDKESDFSAGGTLE
jgi:hypothetical protein